MKKKMGFIALLLFVTIGLIFTIGFKENETIVLKLDINQEVYKTLVEESNELVAQNDKKLGRGLEKSFINFKISDIKETSVEDNITKFEGSADGVIHTESGNYNYKTTGVMEEVTLKSGKKILNGSFEGSVVNKEGEDFINLKLLYDLETKKAYVNVTNGYMGDTAAIPFGTTTVTKEEMAELYKLLTGEEVITNEK